MNLIEKSAYIKDSRDEKGYHVVCAIGDELLACGSLYEIGEGVFEIAKIAVSSPTSTAPKMPTVLSPAISKVNTAKTIPITTLAIIAVMAHLLPRLQFVPHIIFHPYIYYEKVTSVVKTTQNTVYKY